MPDQPEKIDPLDAEPTAVLAVTQQVMAAYLRRYHRHEIIGDLDGIGERQVLFVGNHGFGGLFDLNVFALMALGHTHPLGRPVTILTHQITWTLGVGPLIEPFGMRPASRESAQEGFARGHHVLVLPGGDLDASKAHKDRDRIVFGGRSGFARLAMEAGVPIVPVVTAGAGDSLYVFTDGQGLAKALRVDRLLRVKALPVALSIPWGLNIGLGPMLPYIPLPAKLTTRVLPPMVPESDESPAAFAHRVEATMQTALTELAERTR